MFDRPKVYFYAPQEEQQELLTKNYDYWVGSSSNFVAWIAPTYFHLKQAGFPCEITARVPEQGILLADRDSLGNVYQYLGKTMIICAKSDRDYHPSAHIHILHNSQDAKNFFNKIWNPYYIEHWPLPELLPRESARNTLVKNIGYLGSRSQLAEELKSVEWSESVAQLDCEWLPIFEPSQWNDYREIDVVVAIRSFKKTAWFHKGAIKLFNAWRGEVPAIVSPESAFLAEKKSDLDFIVVNSLDSTLAAIADLKTNPALYLAAVENSKKRAQELTKQKTLEKWLNFFENFAFPIYKKWQKLSTYQQQMLFYQRYLKFKSDNIIYRLSQLN
jgi:hypothetical protein